MDTLVTIIIIAVVIIIILGIIGSSGSSSSASSPSRSSGSNYSAPVNLNNISLHDSRDTRVTLSSDKRQTIAVNRQAVQRVSLASYGVDLSLSWFSNVERLIDEANTIIANSSRPALPTTDANFIYHRNLYYRLIKAGKLLEEAENKVGREVLKLHKVKFDHITADQRKAIMTLQKELPVFQSLLSKMKKDSWNLTHSQKYRAGSCGHGGKIWLDRNLENKRAKYGK